MRDGTRSLSLGDTSSESQHNGNGFGALKTLGVAAGSLMAIIGLLAWTVHQIQKPILEGLADERAARVAADHELANSLQAVRIGQIYQLDAIAAPPDSPERDRIVARAKRILLEGPKAPDER